MDRGGTIVEVELGQDAVGQRFDLALAKALPDVSRARLQTLLSDGHITLCGAGPAPRASARVGSPMRLTITLPPPEPAVAEPQNLPLVIVYEDSHLIVVDKPAGMVVHPANGNPDGTLVNALLHHCAGQLSGIGGVARPGIVHRIDKDTSGLIVVAKSDKAHEGLAQQFFDHSIDRVYWAIVNGRPMPVSGTIDAPLARSSHDRKKIAVVGDGRGKRAVTHFRTLEVLTGLQWLNAGSKRGGPIRCACTWPISAIRCWATPSMADRAQPSLPSLEATVSPGRRCMPRDWGLFIRSGDMPSLSTVRCRKTCRIC
jgi:23S rRNA pseudouridine1911/1915/1917 synthase